jgi:putative RecB family exonuclease
MTVYSHSRISCFETCPYQYKLKYIDRIKPEIENTIESFMGDLVHRALERLYINLRFQKITSKEELLKIYNDLWEEEYSEEILIVKSDRGFSQENYRLMGEKFLSDYYDRYHPFNQLTILGIETKDRMMLPDGNYWHVRIDKFACDDNGNYYVCDYKTNSRMKEQQEADSDRQLALYSAWVKKKFKDAKSVKLLWHMLAFNKDVISERTDEQIEELQKEVVEKIKEIENTTEFPRNISGLCDYCGYKKICPSFQHQLELEVKENVKEFRNDQLKLVDEFSSLKDKIKELKEKQEHIRNELVNFSKEKNVDVIYGSNYKVSVKEFDKIVLPENREELIKLLKDKGLWEELSTINYMKLNSQLLRGELDEDVKSHLDVEKCHRLSLSKK